MAVIGARYTGMEYTSPYIMEIQSNAPRFSIESDPFKDPPMVSTRALSSTSSFEADYDNEYKYSADSVARSDSDARFTEMRVMNTSGRRHYRIDNITANTEHLIVSSQFTKGKPDLTLHEGNSDIGPVKGAARMHFFSKDMDVAIGDPDDLFGDTGRETQWIKLESKSIFSTIRQWKMPYPIRSRPGSGVLSTREQSPPVLAAPEAGKSYVWKRTRNLKGLGEFSDIRLTKATFKHMKLTDISTGRVVAIYVNNPKSWSHVGTFYFSSGMSEDWTTAALMSGMIILEEWRRNE